jgi:hypothetical protein
MGLLDSMQNVLFKQSTVAKDLKRQKAAGAMPQMDVQPQPRMGITPLPALERTPGVSGIGATNPFMMSSDTSGINKNRQTGRNSPLSQPMFIGYHNEKAIYGGGQLFMLG